MSQILTDLDFNSVSKIINLPNGVNAGDAVNVGQLNAAVEGISWKTSARVATTANINLTSPGATIDGVTMATGDRILVKNQTAQAENDIYVWNGASTPATRALDANSTQVLGLAAASVGHVQACFDNVSTKTELINNIALDLENPTPLDTALDRLEEIDLTTGWPS